MLYSILRVIVRGALKIYFRKIDVSGLQHLKPGQAQIIASNHPSGFLEPLLMACFFPRDLYFLVRGDVFENKIVRYLLEATHQIPIYRFKDGFSKLRNNAGSIQAASAILARRKCLLIFVEGGTKSIKMLRPLQKGFVKLAAETIQKDGSIQVEILPVGINFSDSTKFKSEVLIKVGEPIIVENQKITATLGDYNSYVSELVQDVSTKMRTNIIHLDDQKRKDTLEWVLEVNKSFSRRTDGPVLVNDDKYLESNVRLANQLNSLEIEKYEALHTEIEMLKTSLTASKFTLSDIHKTFPSRSNMAALLIGFLPALLGFIMHFVPLFLAKILARKLAPSQEFFGTIRLVFSILFIFIYYVSFFILSLTGWVPFYFIGILLILGWLTNEYYMFSDRFVLRSKRTFCELKENHQKIFFEYFPR